MADSLPEEQQQVILCDMCTDEDRKPARKTCMKCEISMCVQHLQAHLTTPVLLQTHPLTEPMAPGDAGLGGATKCPQHGKLVEYYCLDDLTSVCVACAIEDQHRLHNVKTLSTAHKEVVEKICAEQKALVKTEGESMSLEKWEKGEREKLTHSSVRLVEAVSSLRDITLTSVQSSVSARMVPIKTSKDIMQVAQKEKDTFRFLQMFSGVYQAVEKAKAVDLRKGLEPGEDRDKLVQELRQSGGKMLAQAHQLLGSLLILVDPENHQEAFSTNKELTFDTNTLGSGMAVSKDHRKVFYSSWLGQCSAHTLLLQGTQSNFGSHRWMISLTKHCDWTIGLCDKESAKSLNDGHVYGLRCQGNQLSSLTTDYYDLEEQKGPGLQKNEKPQTEKERRVSSQMIDFSGENGAEKMSRPQKVEVFLDFASSTLSFFNRSSQYQRAEILTVKMCNNSWDLSPFVNLGEKKGEHTRSQTPRDFWGKEQPYQQQWKCTCGQVYQNTHGTNAWGQTSPTIQQNKFPQSICSCGGAVGTPCIMEVLCELL